MALMNWGFEVKASGCRYICGGNVYFGVSLKHFLTGLILSHYPVTYLINKATIPPTNLLTIGGHLTR